MLVVFWKHLDMFRSQGGLWEYPFGYLWGIQVTSGDVIGMFLKVLNVFNVLNVFQLDVRNLNVACAKRTFHLVYIYIYIY